MKLPSRLFKTVTTTPAPKPSGDFKIPRDLYLEHGAIFAPSGHGKSQFLQLLFMVLLDDDPPAMFIIDSQGDMLKKMEWLECFNPDDGIYRDRLVIIDPEDPRPPALNLFHLGRHDALIDSLFQYIFTAIDNTLTPQQSTTVTFLMRLMQVIPNATINTLRQILEDRSKTLEKSPYAEYIRHLDPIARDFFANQFFDTGTIQVTKSSIARRLYALLANPVFATIFGAYHNRFDALAAIQQKKIVLINTSQRTLGDGSAVFGRFFIAQALAAAYNRPEGNRDLALLIVDEASEYYDYMTERLLSTARKFGLGMMSASQFLSQMSEKVKAAINGNTAIKIVGPVSHGDATALSKEMYTEVDFIRSLKKSSTHTEFAFYIRGLTPAAVKVSIPFGRLENMVRMTTAQHAAMREANRQRYGVTSGPPPQKPAVLSHQTPVNLLGFTTTGLLDTGADVSALPVTNLQIIDQEARFDFMGQTFQLAITRVSQISGLTGSATFPYIRTQLTIANHTAEEEFALNYLSTGVIVGRTFLKGRILIDSDPSKPSTQKW